MSITASEMTPADIAAVTNGGNEGGWGGSWSSWIIIFLIFAMFGWGGNRGGYGFGGSDAGAANNYVLASDFATIQRQLSDGFGGVEKGLDTIRNGLCDGFYTEAQLVNGVNMNMMNGFNAVQTQLADCCCKTQSNIKDTQNAIERTGANIQYAIKDCCCENEKIAMQNRFDAAQNTCGILQAIDKSSDRVIDFLSAERTRQLESENQALRLAASQQAQNAYLVNQLRPCPVPAYAVPNPFCYSGCGNFGGCGYNA